MECLLWDQKVERKTSQLLRTTGERLRRLDLPTPVVPPDHCRHSSCPNFGKRSTFDTQKEKVTALLRTEGTAHSALVVVGPGVLLEVGES